LRACSTNAAVITFAPRAAVRKSARCLRRSMADGRRRRASGTEPAAAVGAALCEHPAAALGRHARAETMTALAHQLARLVGPLHRVFSRLQWLPLARRGGAGSVGYARPPSDNRNWSGLPPFSSPAAYKGGQPWSSMQGRLHPPMS